MTHKKLSAFMTAAAALPLIASIFTGAPESAVAADPGDDNACSLAAVGKDADIQIFKIADYREEVILALDAKARAALEANPYDKDGTSLARLNPLDLVSTLLMQKGACLTDAIIEGKLVPAVQKRNARQMIVNLSHYMNGKLNDAPDGSPARQDFSETTGLMTYAARHKDGVRIKILSWDEMQELDKKNIEISNILNHSIIPGATLPQP